jgi:ribosomal protein L7/L12
MEQTNKTTEKKIDAIKVMRELRDKLSLEIMNMTYEQERAYLDELLSKSKLQKK